MKIESTRALLADSARRAQAKLGFSLPLGIFRVLSVVADIDDVGADHVLGGNSFRSLLLGQDGSGG